MTVFVRPKAVGWILGGALGAMALVLAWFFLQAYPLGGEGRLVRITVHPGDSLSVIAGELHRAGVIASPLAFRIDLLLGAPTVYPGTYQFHQRSSFAVVKGVLAAPLVTVTPGLTLHEVALQVAAREGATYADHFLADAASLATSSPFHPAGSLEGLIGVGQYRITPQLTPRRLLGEMVAAFDAQAASLGLDPSTTRAGLSAYQLITAASIVDKEGYYPRNMPKVARVIYNRLARGGPLQMDATVLYALGMDGGTVTHAMLTTKSPYNTYLVAGLTPTPICTVSRDALRAVLNPPPGPWLYFTVVNRSGTEAFATTFAQQLANERIGAANGVR